MHNQTRIGYLGLADNEVKVLKSIFNLSAQFNEPCVLVDPSGLSTADLVVVNIDDPLAVKAWNETRRVNRLATPVTVSSTGKTIKGVLALSRPMRLQNLVGVINDAVEQHTNVKYPGAEKDSEDLLKILVVDDSYPVRNYMEQALSRLVKGPYRISFAESGELALAKMQRRAFDLLFLDVMMQGVDGYKICKAVKASYTSHVIMLTSKKSPFDKVRGTMSGCDAYITKPPTDQRLREAIENFSSWRDKNKSRLNK